MNGIFNEVREIVEASDKLISFYYEMIANFYTLCEKHKIHIPAVPIEFYTNYLTISETERKSISKEVSHHRTPPRTPRGSTLQSVNYILSPMQRASINSPKEKLKRIDEEFQIEKKKLENTVQQKEMLIFELQDQVKEKIERMEKLGKLTQFYKFF